MPNKFQVGTVGGIRKVINTKQNASTATTIAGLESATITVGQLKTLLGNTVTTQTVNPGSPSAGAQALTVTNGTTSVQNVTVIDVPAGINVSAPGGNTAVLAIPLPLTVSDGTHNVTSVSNMLFSNAVNVSSTTAGAATVMLLPFLKVTDGSTLATSIGEIIFSGASVSTTSTNTSAVTVTVAAKPLTVTDSSTTATSIGEIIFSGASVSTTSTNTSAVTVTITGGGRPLTVTDSSTTATSIGEIIFSGASVSTTSTNTSAVTVTVAAKSLTVTDGTHNATSIGELIFSGASVSTTSTNTSAATITISTAVGANPSSTVGLSAVNGTATTFMRSDGAPALSQAIVPTWTGAHTFTPSSSVTALTINAASGTLAAQINGAANQTTLGVQASSTTSQSFGMVINAGTNTNDFALSFGNSAASQSFFKIRGDGAISVYGQTYEGPGTINASGLYVAGTAVSTAVGANPSGSIGLSAVNGSATTFMRSDGTHALSQAIVPTWTGAHTFTPSSSVTALTINAASGALAAQINGAANQTTLGVQASSTASQSFGIVVNAGTNSNDFALSVGNSASSHSFLQIKGDGTGYIAPAISGVSALSWDSSGNVSIGSNSTGGIYCNASGGTTVQNGVFQVNGSSAGTARVSLNTQATTGAQSASFTATNKPGAATQTSPAKWLPVLLDGTTYYIPAFS